MSRVRYDEEYFDALEYPEGYRCASCRLLFEDGQRVVRWFLGDMWTACTCEPCAEDDAPLCADHPLRNEANVVLQADGRVGL